MQKATLDAIRAHAVRVYPRECCGLLIIERGRERYVEGSNSAVGSEHCRLPADEYAAAEDRGGVVGFVHSHPDDSAQPSEADRSACEGSGLPWHIVEVRRGDDGVVRSGALVTVEPVGFQVPLVGRSFAHGVLDCYTLVRDWYRIEQEIWLPDFDRRDSWWENGGDLYMQHYRDAGFVALPGSDPVPERGDVILMQIRAPVPNHAGVYLGDGTMLHHLYDRLSSRDVYGGYWREVTRLILRFEG
ncbi:C40 family peptidase [Burkholderia pseudomallei]|uniref:C40 family peptidase n=1 Tax=Burkholderia pseudomallei TaxID=28450 RepID=UPI0011079852|nr:C40 family peptidase [Burkholderia pseudomallei]QCU53096.1 peptidase P60 [Burkholderia pseudomallei]QTB80426.1 C40 family peptidase [Burkholderia pseudomallei]